MRLLFFLAWSLKKISCYLASVTMPVKGLVVQIWLDSPHMSIGHGLDQVLTTGRDSEGGPEKLTSYGPASDPNPSYSNPTDPHP